MLIAFRVVQALGAATFQADSVAVVFLVNVPVGVVALVAGHFLLPRTRERGSGPVDGIAVVLLATATTALLLVLARPAGVGHVWREPLVRRVKGGPLATGLLLTALPVGFVLGAALPWRVPRAGSALSTVACGVLVRQVHPIALVAWGLGLGLFIPADNAAVLGALPAVTPGRAAARAFGVAVPFFVHAH